MTTNDFIFGANLQLPASDQSRFRRAAHDRQIGRDQLIVEAITGYLAAGTPPVEPKLEPKAGFKGLIHLPHALTFEIKGAAGDRHPVDVVADAVSHFARKLPPVAEPAPVIPAADAGTPTKRASVLGFLKLGGRGPTAGAVPAGA